MLLQCQCNVVSTTEILYEVLTAAYIQTVVILSGRTLSTCRWSVPSEVGGIKFLQSCGTHLSDCNIVHSKT